MRLTIPIMIFKFLMLNLVTNYMIFIQLHSQNVVVVSLNYYFCFFEKYIFICSPKLFNANVYPSNETQYSIPSSSDVFAINYFNFGYMAMFPATKGYGRSSDRDKYDHVVNIDRYVYFCTVCKPVSVLLFHDFDFICRQAAPAVSYNLAIDYWMVFCVFVVFIALSLFTAMHW